jgi:hypothetical protein
MNFEKIRSTRAGAFLAASVAAAALAGCGDDIEKIKPIRVPADAVDLGDNPIKGSGLFGSSGPGRSFAVPSDEVKDVYCGGVVVEHGYLIGGGHAEPEKQEFLKQSHVVNGETSQVDCIYDDWLVNYEDVQEKMTVEYLDPSS